MSGARGPSVGSPVQERCQSEPSKRVQGVEHLSREDCWRGLAVSGPGKRRLMGDLGNVCKELVGGNEEESLRSEGCLGLHSSARGGSVGSLLQVVQVLRPRRGTALRPLLRDGFARTKGSLFSTGRLLFVQPGHSWVPAGPPGRKGLEPPLRQTYPGVEALPLGSRSHCQRGLGVLKIPVGA